MPGFDAAERKTAASKRPLSEELREQSELLRLSNEVLSERAKAASAPTLELPDKVLCILAPLFPLLSGGNFLPSLFPLLACLCFLLSSLFSLFSALFPLLSSLLPPLSSLFALLSPLFSLLSSPCRRGLARPRSPLFPLLSSERVSERASE